MQSGYACQIRYAIYRAVWIERTSSRTERIASRAWVVRSCAYAIVTSDPMNS